jgi:hypothetical protein
MQLSSCYYICIIAEAFCLWLFFVLCRLECRSLCCRLICLKVCIQLSIIQRRRCCLLSSSMWGGSINVLFLKVHGALLAQDRHLSWCYEDEDMH